MIKCGCCGGGYSMISKDLLGCSTARNKGTCDNRLNIRRDALEASILNGLRKHLMEPELFKEFCAEFTREVNRLRIERGADLEGWKKELVKIGKQISQIIDAITDGMYHPSMKEKMTGLEARQAELEEKLANADEPPPLTHPNMAGLYAQRIGQVYQHLQDEDGRTQAAETFRSLVDQITLMPDNGELAIVLRGDLGAILRFVAGKKNPDFLAEAEALDNLLSPEFLVAGARNYRYRHSLQVPV
nr:zinc ribbon domain-containing protein [Pseudomonas sp. GX19020]